MISRQYSRSMLIEKKGVACKDVCKGNKDPKCITKCRAKKVLTGKNVGTKGKLASLAGGIALGGAAIAARKHFKNKKQA